MANVKISELTVGATIQGPELIETVQNGENVQTTAQEIANLAVNVPVAADQQTIEGTGIVGDELRVPSNAFDALGAAQGVLDYILSINPYRGDYNGTTAMPTTGGTYTDGKPGQGNKWRLTNSLTVNGFTFGPDTIIEAAVDDPQSLADWNIYAMQIKS